MKSYEVWYDDIQGEHFLGVVSAESTQAAIDMVWNDLGYDYVSKPQLKAYDIDR